MGKCSEKLLLFRKLKATAVGTTRIMTFFYFYLGRQWERVFIAVSWYPRKKNPNEPRASEAQPETLSHFAGRTSIGGGSRLAHNPVDAIDLNGAVGVCLSAARFITCRPSSWWKIDILLFFFLVDGWKLWDFCVEWKFVKAWGTPSFFLFFILF